MFDKDFGLAMRSLRLLFNIARRVATPMRKELLRKTEEMQAALKKRFDGGSATKRLGTPLKKELAEKSAKMQEARDAAGTSV